jgi:hypothetical protein
MVCKAALPKYQQLVSLEQETTRGTKTLRDRRWQ